MRIDNFLLKRRNADIAKMLVKLPSQNKVATPAPKPIVSLDQNKCFVNM